MRIRVALLAVAAATAMLSGGCIPSTSPHTPDTTTTTTGPGVPTAGKYPYVAEILYMTSSNAQGGLTATGELHCSGSLIAKDWLITAAHCITNPKDTSAVAPLDQVFVMFGREGQRRTPVKVTKILRHPGYVPADEKGEFVHGSVDVALIHLASVIGATPLKLSPKSPAAETEVILAGWPCLQYNAKNNICVKLATTVQVRKTTVVKRSACGATVGEICSSSRGKSVALSADSGGAQIMSTSQGPQLGGIIIGASPEFDVSVELPRSWIADHTGVKAK